MTDRRPSPGRPGTSALADAVGPSTATRWSGSHPLSWLAVLGIWTIPALLSASQRYLFLRGVPEYRISWWEAFWRQAPGWYVWTPLTLVILWLGQRFPLQRGRWERNLALHLPTALAMALLHAGVLAVVGRIGRPALAAEYGLLTQTLRQLSVVLHIDLLLYAAVLGVGYAVAYQRTLREREILATQLQGELAQAQLQALRMQLNPHFLFNALNAISSLVRKQENAAAVRMLAGLSDLLRHSLEESDAQEVRLEDELRFLRRYLEIEQARFPDRLRVEYEIDPAALDAHVPSLVLQPLAENAIKHGISQRSRGGRIVVTARRGADFVELSVRDDGPGPGEREPRGTGVGLANTRSRLEKLYAGRGTLRLSGEPGIGATAILRIPIAPSRADRTVQ